MTRNTVTIICKRFDEVPDYNYLKNKYNDEWIYECAHETHEVLRVRGGIYWRQNPKLFDY